MSLSCGRNAARSSGRSARRCRCGEPRTVSTSASSGWSSARRLAGALAQAERGRTGRGVLQADGRARRGRRRRRRRAGPGPAHGGRGRPSGRVRLPCAMPIRQAPTVADGQSCRSTGQAGEDVGEDLRRRAVARRHGGGRDLRVDRPAGVEQLPEVRARVGHQPRVQRHQALAAQQVLEVDVEEDDVERLEQLRHAGRGRGAAAEREDAGELGQQRGQQLPLGLLEPLAAELDHELAGGQAVRALEVVVEVAELDAEPFGGQPADGALPEPGGPTRISAGPRAPCHHRSCSALR